MAHLFFCLILLTSSGNAVAQALAMTNRARRSEVPDTEIGFWKRSTQRSGWRRRAGEWWGRMG